MKMEKKFKKMPVKHFSQAIDNNLVFAIQNVVDINNKLLGFDIDDDSLDGDGVEDLTYIFRKVANDYQGNW